MNEPQVVPFVLAMAVFLMAALAAWLRSRHVIAQTINVIPVALIVAVMVVALIIQPVGQPRSSDLLLLAGLIALVATNVVPIIRSVRWALLFWLTWLVNGCLLVGLVYLQCFMRIF